MNKVELSKKVAEELGLKKGETENIVSAVFETVAEALKAGEKVNISGFGKFEVRERAARPGRNPQTGEAIEIAASKAPAFKPSQALKDSVKQ